MSNYKVATNIKSHIFRAYDIRGRVGDELNDDVYYSVGLAVGSILFEKGLDQVVVGFDGRLDSESFSLALIAGLVETGMAVTSVGLVSSPVLYYALHNLDISSGLMVTGSHNPKHDNGIKIVVDGKSLTSTGVKSIYQRMKEQRFLSGKGRVQTTDVTKKYVDEIAKENALARPLKVAIDCGNGVAGAFAPALFRRIGADVLELFCEVDGNFPNHHPDPSVTENLSELIELVQREQCDIGFAFDGDADRLGVVTGDGEIIWPDRQLMMLAEDILSRNPGAKVVYDVKCTWHLKSVIEQNHGQAVMCPTGHSIVKAKMREIDAKLAGEMSGHLFIREKWYGFDDAIYAGVRLLQILSESQASPVKQFEKYPNSVNTPEIKIPIAEEEKFPYMENLSESLSFDEGNLVDIDGVRWEFPFGWGLVRASNTGPCLVCRFEANSEANLEYIKGLFREKLLGLKPLLAIPF